MVSVENLTKKFKEETVIENVNLHMEKGKIYGLVGHNGTAINLLLNFIAVF